MTQGFDEEWTKCDDLNFGSRFIKISTHIGMIIFLLYFIGYKKGLYNFISFWFTIYHIIGSIGGVCEFLSCNYAYKDVNKWTTYNKILDNIGATTTTMIMSLWYTIILCSFKPWPTCYCCCFKLSLTNKEIIKLSKIMFILIPIIIIPIIQQIIFIVFGYESGTGAGITNIIRLCGGICGFIWTIIVIRILKSDENVNISNYEFWFILIWCGVIEYLISSISVFFYNFFWGKILVYQYFWLNTLWIYYVESKPHFKVFAFNNKWNKNPDQIEMTSN